MIKSFENFTLENYSYYNPGLSQDEAVYPYGSDFFSVEDLLKIHESKSGSNFSLNEFKSFFYAPLKESEGYFDDEMIESLYSCYEFSQMYESRTEWFESPDVKKFMMESDSHYIFLCSGEVYTISKKSFEILESLNEGETGWLESYWAKAVEIGKKVSAKVGNYMKKKYDETKVVVKKVVNKAGEVVKKVRDSAEDVWNKVSDGAKKAWNWCKDSVATIWNIVKSMSPLEMVSGVISILGAASGWLAAIGGTILAAICTALGGGIDTYSGAEKTYQGASIIKNSKIATDANGGIVISSLVDPAKKSISSLTGGVLGMSLGLYDVSVGVAAALANPAAGTMSLAVKSASKKVADSWIINTLKNIDGFLEEIIGKILAKLGNAKVISGAAKALDAKGTVGKAVVSGTKDVAKKAEEVVAGEVSEKTKETISDSIQSSAINQILGWLWDKLLKAGKALTDGIAFMVGLPGKISSIIGDISNKASTTIEKILAGGLSNIVKPLADVLNKLVNKFLKPRIEAAQKWLERQIKTNSAVREVLDQSKSNFQGVPPTNPKSAIKIEKLKADEKDLKRLKSLPPINKGLRKGAENAAEENKKVDSKKSSNVKKSSDNKGSKEISKDKKIKESFGFSESGILGFDDFILSY
jgi:hypothetical protein